jgi:hypothetical protein
MSLIPPDVSFPSRCPREWYGPDDWSEGDDPSTELNKRRQEIAEWQAAWDDLPWYKRFWRTLIDEV